MRQAQRAVSVLRDYLKEGVDMWQDGIAETLDVLEADIERFNAAMNADGTWTTSSGETLKTLPELIKYLQDRLTGVLNRGDWQSGTHYRLNDLVLSGGYYYVCGIPHDSTVFSDDLTAGKWALWPTSNISLSDSVTNADSTVAASSQAVKTAYDEAILAKQAAEVTAGLLDTKLDKSVLNTTGLHIWISPDGSDANSGLAIEYPVKTWTRALEVSRSQIAWGAYVNFNFLPGVYNYGIALNEAAIGAARRANIQANWGEVAIAPQSGDCVILGNTGNTNITGNITYTVPNFGKAFHFYNYSAVTVVGNHTFASTGRHTGIYLGNFCYLWSRDAVFNFSGDMDLPIHLFNKCAAAFSGNVVFNFDDVSVVNATVGAFSDSNVVFNPGCTMAGQVTGRRYSANKGSLIHTYGAGYYYIPGTVDGLLDDSSHYY